MNTFNKLASTAISYTSFEAKDLLVVAGPSSLVPAARVDDADGHRHGAGAHGFVGRRPRLSAGTGRLLFGSGGARGRAFIFGSTRLPAGTPRLPAGAAARRQDHRLLRCAPRG